MINGSLQIGKNAIVSAQAGLTVTGNNMANAATPSYSRQTVELVPTQYAQIVPGKYTGTGVQVNAILRQVDEALNGRIRNAVGERSSYEVLQQALARVEASFNELTEEDLSSRLNAFFGAWNGLQAEPDETAQRSIVIQESQNLANFVTDLRSELRIIQTDLDEQVKFQVKQADAIVQKVAEINKQIVTTEAGKAGSAAALRDERDALLKELNGMINITTREMEGGAVNVYVDSDPLVQYGDARHIAYVEREDENGEMLAEVVFTDNEAVLELKNGKVHGLITARDTGVGGIIGDLDTWTENFIFEVNKLHSLGRGLKGYTEVTGLYKVEDTTASLGDTSSTKLPWAVDNGVFYINVEDPSGQITTHQVSVQIGMDGSDMSMEDLVTAMNTALDPDGAGPLSSPITVEIDTLNRLHMKADANYSFTFSGPGNREDATNVLAALGVNCFFEGENATDIAVRGDIDAESVAASGAIEARAGNGDVAGSIGQLGGETVADLGGVSLQNYFSTMVGQLATDSKEAQDNYTASDVIVQTLESERQGISGVSLDEEAIKMMGYQKAFQGAARFISIIDQMLNEIISMAG